MCFFRRPKGPVYVVLDIIKSSAVESTAAAYESSYLLLTENVRMRLQMRTLDPRRIERYTGPAARRRAEYTTESLQPLRVDSFEEFERVTAHAPGSMTLMKLSVHPEDVDKAIHVLEKAGMRAERSANPRAWR